MDRLRGRKKSRRKRKGISHDPKIVIEEDAASIKKTKEGIAGEGFEDKIEVKGGKRIRISQRAGALMRKLKLLRKWKRPEESLQGGTSAKTTHKQRGGKNRSGRVFSRNGSRKILAPRLKGTAHQLTGERGRTMN